MEEPLFLPPAGFIAWLLRTLSFLPNGFCGFSHHKILYALLCQSWDQVRVNQITSLQLVLQQNLRCRLQGSVVFSMLFCGSGEDW